MMLKRMMDLVASILGLILLSPLFALVAVCIKLDSEGPVFFRQERIGKGFRSFYIYKFRSMRVNALENGPLITAGGDKRVTKVGRVIRKTKIDELPQLINVLKGEMSFVGPRPEVIKYVELFRSDYEKLLSVCPGITDPASLAFSDEESVLSSSADWENDYVKRILPDKIKLSLGYVEHHSILLDLKLIFSTIFKL